MQTSHKIKIITKVLTKISNCLMIDRLERGLILLIWILNLNSFLIESNIFKNLYNSKILKNYQLFLGKNQIKLHIMVKIIKSLIRNNFLKWKTTSKSGLNPILMLIIKEVVIWAIFNWRFNKLKTFLLVKLIIKVWKKD